MNFRRCLIALLVATALLLTTGSLYAVPAFGTNRNGQAARPKKPAAFHYVCPMHEDVTSKTPGKKCWKCKMKLEKRRVKEPTETPGQ